MSQLEQYKADLAKLEENAAMYGVNVPSELQNNINWHEARIRELERGIQPQSAYVAIADPATTVDPSKPKLSGDTPMSTQWQLSGPIGFVAVYAIWLVLCVFVGWLCVQINGMLIDISIALRFNQWVGRAVRQLSLPFLGVFWLVFIFWTEHYLRTGMTKGLLWQRTIRIIIALAILAVIVLSVRAVL